jgi:AcrR family transcriptional regulator
MGEKSIRKKQLILEKARAVFAERGYLDVTMKDIVEACQISRGGLYLYFESTREIFLEVLAMKESNESGEEDVFTKAVSEHASSSDILALFLQEQKKELCNQTGSLTRATYEFFFANQMPKNENPLKMQFDGAVQIIEKLITDGVQTGEFICDDPRGAARNIMYVLEGLRIMAQTVGITEKAINKEILYLMKGLLKEA